MDEVFRYIRSNLTGDLSLEVLEEQFFVSRHHLCREFKKLTGQTIHSYIVKSRLDLCKKYIETGKSIKEVYSLDGFGSYNHFFRAFKKEYSMTPKEYYESLT
jgi:AraC-like DNA-binding protein